MLKMNPRMLRVDFTPPTPLLEAPRVSLRQSNARGL